MTHITIEAVVDSLAAAHAAAHAGATRLELCTALELGGLTPSTALARLVAQQVHIPVMALVRPRAGHFHYRPDELQVMRHDIQHLLHAGVAGIVIGCTGPDARLDTAAMQQFRQAAGTAPLTCHRAFDRLTHQAEALEQLIQLGYDRVLTSGAAPTAHQGIPRLQALVAQAAGRITILPGAGINPANARHIITSTGATEIHLSAIQRVQRTHTTGPAMGTMPDADTWTMEPDPDKVRGVRQALEAMA